MEQGCRYPQPHGKFRPLEKGVKGCSPVAKIVTARCVRNKKKEGPCEAGTGLQQAGSTTESAVIMCSRHLIIIN